MAQCCGVLCFIGLRNLGLPFFLKSLGYDNSFSMLIMSFLSTVCIFQLIVSIIFSGFDIKRLLITNYLIAHFTLVLCCLGYIVMGISPTLVIFGTFIYFLFTALGDTFWWPFIHSQLVSENVSTFFARLRITWASFSFLGILILTSIVNELKNTRDFTLFIISLGLLGACRVLFLFPLKPDQESKRDANIKIKSALGLLKKLLSLKELYFIFFFVFFEPLFFGPILIYFLDGVGVSKGNNFLVQGIGLVSTVVSLLFVNNQLKRIGDDRFIKLAKIPFTSLIGLLCLISLLEEPRSIFTLVMVVKFFAGLISAGVHLIYIKKLFLHVNPMHRALSMSGFGVLIFGLFFISEFLLSQLLGFVNALNVGNNSFFYVFITYLMIALVINFIKLITSK